MCARHACGAAGRRPPCSARSAQLPKPCTTSTKLPNATRVASFFSLPTSALKTNCEARRGRLSAYVEPQRAAAAAETGLRGAVGCARVQREGRNHPGKRALHWLHLLRCCAWAGAETAAPELFRRNGNGRARGPARAVGGDGGDDEEDELRLDQGTEPLRSPPPTRVFLRSRSNTSAIPPAAAPSCHVWALTRRRVCVCVLSPAAM